MRYLLILILLSATAQADHHRLQADDFTGRYLSHMNVAQPALVSFIASMGPLNAADQAAAALALKYLNNGIEQANEVQCQLKDDQISLDHLRRKINQPQHASKGGESDSMLVNARVPASVLITFIGRGDQAKFKKAMISLLHAWNNGDRADWHIVDAIREEVYNDPDFQ